MPYVRFVPGYRHHPKRLACSIAANWLWACSVDYAVEHLTDGFVSETAARSLCPQLQGPALKRAIAELLDVGSWERAPGRGYLVHDFGKYNVSKARAEQDQANSRQRYYRWADKRDSNGVANALDPEASIALARAVTSALDPRPPNEALSQSVSQSIDQSKTKTSETAGPFAHAMGSNSNGIEDHEHRQSRARQLLKHAFPDLKPTEDAKES